MDLLVWLNVAIERLWVRISSTALSSAALHKPLTHTSLYVTKQYNLVPVEWQSCSEAIGR